MDTPALDWKKNYFKKFRQWVRRPRENEGLNLFNGHREVGFIILSLKVSLSFQRNTFDWEKYRIKTQGVGSGRSYFKDFIVFYNIFWVNRWL